MFDPTIFDNLKVALENRLYDLDNLTGQVRVMGRVDRIDMATMSREFGLQFTLADGEAEPVTAEMRLQASLKDLAAEILEIPEETPGCVLTILFHLHVHDVDRQCGQIGAILQEIWDPDEPPVQTLSFVYGEQGVPTYADTAELRFKRKINEDQMGDLPELIEHMMRTLAELAAV